MTRDEMIQAFNEWMRLYVEDPKAFKAEFESIREFCHAQVKGEKPSYGEHCTTFLCKLASSL